MTLRSMYSGLSGLREQLTAMDVVGNNIANVNTVGFKSARVNFADLLSETLTGAVAPQDGGIGGRNPMQVGLGLAISSIDVLHTQGNLQNTGNITDLAVQGSGFFVVSDGGENSYSRAGNFSFDRNGAMVHSSGNKVQGWNADINGNINTATSVADVIVPVGQTIPAKGTENIQFIHNLDSQSSIEGSAVLQPGNTCGAVNVQGVWPGQLNISDVVGTHTISVQSYTLTSTVPAGGINGADTLADLGITDYDDFKVHVDGDVTGRTISGLASTSTVEELVIAINSQVPGVTAVFAGGEIVITRDKAGANYSVDTSNTTVFNDPTNGTGLPTAAGISDVLFSSRTVNNVVYQTAADVAAATFRYESSDGLSVISSTALTFGAGDTTLTGINGVTISAGAAGNFKSGTGVIATVAPATHITSTNVYDSLGRPHPVKVTFERVANNRWLWNASSDTGDVAGNGQISFSSNGNISTGVTGTITVTASGGADALNLTPNFSNITQYASESTVLASDQDGFTAGTLQTFTIGSDGVLTGLYDNGLTRNLAQVAMATFNNAGGLLRTVGSMFKPSNNSGEAQIGPVNSGGRGSVSAGTLEMSNVDLAREFSNMITYQRGFQSAAKMITTGDEMLQVLVGLKR